MPPVRPPVEAPAGRHAARGEPLDAGVAERSVVAEDAPPLVVLNTAPLVVLSPLRQVRLALVPNAGGAPTTVPMKDPEVPGSSAR